MYLGIHRHWIPVPVLVLSTLVTLDTAFVLCTLHLLTITAAAPPTARYWLLTATLLIGVVTTIALGLYSTETIFNSGVLVRIAVSFALASLLSAAAILYVHQFAVCRNCALPSIRGMLLWFGWVALTRGAVTATFELGLLKRRVIVLGVGALAARIIEIIEQGRNPRLELVAFIGFPGESAVVGRDRLLWYDGNQGSLAEWVPRLGIEEVVVTIGEQCQLPVGPLLKCRRSGIKITRFLDFWERETGTVDLEALHANWLLFSRGFYSQSLGEALKRAVDIVGSLALLLFTLPLQLATACLVKLDSPGPIFYRQERVGLRGRRFMMLKFRSMYADAERHGGPRWAAADDPRITRVGRLIRKLRIDELPQILNVLRGDMSLIGPRPERPFFVDRLREAIPYYEERHLVRPGITGWAQVNLPYGASVDEARHKLGYDLYYVKNCNIFLDLLILLRTVRIVLGLEGR
jgi:sugar transferase (PEP-CTERM system associated)